MAVAAITPIQITEAGIAGVVSAQTPGNTSGGHSFRNEPGRTFIVATNMNGASHNLTIVTPGTVGGNAVADLVVTVADAATKWIKVGDPSVYGQTVTIIPNHADLYVSVVYL